MIPAVWKAARTLRKRKVVFSANLLVFVLVPISFVLPQIDWSDTETLFLLGFVGTVLLVTIATVLYHVRNDHASIPKPAD